MAWTGQKDSGAREYTFEQRLRVVRLLTEVHYDVQHRTTFDDLAADRSVIGIGPRALRAIISDADGVDFVVCVDGSQLWVASSYEEMEGYTRKLEAQTRTMLERIARRRDLGATLPRVQGVLI